MPHHVHLSYVDLYGHMNYASYLEVMELGRWDWAFRCGAIRGWLSHKLTPIVVRVDIDYRRELKPLQRFIVDTRLIAAERRMLRFEQYLLVDDRIHARAHISALLRKHGKVVDAATVAAAAASMLADPLEVLGQRAVARGGHAEVTVAASAE